MNAQHRFLIDARWVGRGGPGRVSELILKGLNEIAPEGEWFVWADPSRVSMLWPNAHLIPSTLDPHQWYSQREFPGPRSVRADGALFPHQLRPLWRIAKRELTFLHDTTPLRHGANAARRVGVKLLLRRAAMLSSVVLTASDYAAMCLRTDLGVPEEKIQVVRYPIDDAAAMRVRGLREGRKHGGSVVYVGRDAPHKNLDRLVRAFSQTAFAASGGNLTLVGLKNSAHDRLQDIASTNGARLLTPGVLLQAELDLVLARASAVVQPSLEEGFGLPVLEALAAGIPVAVSSCGALIELTQGLAPSSFDPYDESDMAKAIDRAVDATAPAPPLSPSLRDFGELISSMMLREATAR